MRKLSDLLPQPPWEGPPLPRGLLAKKSKPRNPNGGMTFVDFTVKSPDKTKSVQLRGMVDTGSTLTRIPTKVAQELGLEVFLRDVPSRLATGQTVPSDLARGYLEVKDKEAYDVFAVLEAETAAIGVVTLEAMGYKVNPVTGELEETEIYI